MLGSKFAKIRFFYYKKKEHDMLELVFDYLRLLHIKMYKYSWDDVAESLYKERLNAEDET